MMVVYDPTSYVMHFFAIPTPCEREAKKLHAVGDFLNTAASEFAQAVGQDRPYHIQMDDFTEWASDRLAFVAPTEVSSGLTLELVVRTLHDMAMLRTTALRKGQFELERVKDLDFSTPLPRPTEKLPSYLGLFRVLYVETDQKERPKRAEVGKRLAKSFAWTWLAEAEPVVTPLGTMLFGVQPRQEHQQLATPTLDLIFVGGRDAAAIAERYPLHPFLVTLPELALCHLKVRNSVENLRHTWLQNLADRERELRDLLPQRGEVERDLLRMLDRNDTLTSRQAELVDAVAHVQLELRTMRTNRANFAAAARPFKRMARKLQHLLIDQWMHSTELQAENDIGHIEGTLQRAGNHFQSIEASAAVYQARELKNINWWQIFLAAVGVVIGLLSLIDPLKALLSWLKALLS